MEYPEIVNVNGQDMADIASAVRECYSYFGQLAGGILIATEAQVNEINRQLKVAVELLDSF